MTVYKRSESGARKAAKEVKPGAVLWVKAEMSQKVAPFEDPVLLEMHEVKYMHRLIPNCPMICGAMSVKRLVLTRGPVYTDRPKGYRAIHEEPPQFFGPLELHGQQYDRPINKRELHSLEERVADYLADKKGMARPKALRTAKSDIAKKLKAAA